MNKKVSIPFSFAVIWILLLLVMNSLKVPHHFRIGIYLNILFILLVILASLHKQVREEKVYHPAVTNFKNCLKNSGKYIIVVTAFMAIYLSYINPQFLANREQIILENALKNESFEEVQKKNAKYENSTEERYIEDLKESFRGAGSVKLNLSLYFLFLFVISVIFSILVPLFYKKIVLRI